MLVFSLTLFVLSILWGALTGYLVYRACRKLGLVSSLIKSMALYWPCAISWNVGSQVFQAHLGLAKVQDAISWQLASVDLFGAAMLAVFAYFIFDGGGIWRKAKKKGGELLQKLLEKVREALAPPLQPIPIKIRSR